MTQAIGSVALVVFEAADCLMAVPASEIRQFVRGTGASAGDETHACDLGEYFGATRAAGLRLRWVRGTRSAWLCVRRVLDVVSVPISAFRPLPKLLRRHRRCGAFVAAGTIGGDVFLLLDPARLRAPRFGAAAPATR